MKPRLAPTLASLILAGLTATGPVLADDALWRDCRTCHAVVAPDGSVLARGGSSAPNLYGIADRPLASDSGFRFYSDDLRAAAATGARWSAANFRAYLTNPDQFLRDLTGNPQAESGMHVELRRGADEVFEFLRGLSQ